MADARVAQMAATFAARKAERSEVTILHPTQQIDTIQGG